jgi:large subunit ribosomal protein L10
VSKQIAPAKREVVQGLVHELESKPVVGVLDIRGIPSSQLNVMRRGLRGTADILVAKKTLVKIALKEAKAKAGNVGQLEGYLTGQPAFIASNLNPFKLFQKLEATKSKAPAKGGEVVKEDIVIKPGETSFKPGPIVGELQKVGVPAAIDQGKVVIKKEKVLVKAGDPIPRDLAPVLTKLEIFPVEVGLNLTALIEDGLVYTPKVLRVDVDQILADVRRGASSSFNLAVYAAYPNDVTIRPILAVANQKAMNLAVNAGIFNAKTAKLFVARAHGQMLSVASCLKDGLDEELKAKLAGAAAAAPTPSGAPAAMPDDKKKEEPKAPDVSQEEAASGLSSLFG